MTLVLISRTELSSNYRKISLGTRIQQGRKQKIQGLRETTQHCIIPRESMTLRHLRMPPKASTGDLRHMHTEPLNTQESCSWDKRNCQSCGASAGIRAVGFNRKTKAVHTISLLLPSSTPQHCAWTAPAQTHTCHMSIFLPSSIYSSRKHNFTAFAYFFLNHRAAVSPA